MRSRNVAVLAEHRDRSRVAGAAEAIRRHGGKVRRRVCGLTQQSEKPARVVNRPSFGVPPMSYWLAQHNRRNDCVASLRFCATFLASLAPTRAPCLAGRAPRLTPLSAGLAGRRTGLRSRLRTWQWRQQRGRLRRWRLLGFSLGHTSG